MISKKECQEIVAWATGKRVRSCKDCPVLDECNDYHKTEQRELPSGKGWKSKCPKCGGTLRKTLKKVKRKKPKPVVDLYSYRDNDDEDKQQFVNDGPGFYNMRVSELLVQQFRAERKT